MPWYEPKQAPRTREREATEIALWAEGEFASLSRAFAEVDELSLRVLNVEPAKPREGMVVFADGTNWNPGGGRGVYVRSSGSWVKL